MKRYEGKESVDMTNKENKKESPINAANILANSTLRSECDEVDKLTSSNLATNTATVIVSQKTKSSNCSLAVAVDKEVSGCVRILFCRETFEHEGLLHHDLNCDHLGKLLSIILLVLPPPI